MSITHSASDASLDATDTSDASLDATESVGVETESLNNNKLTFQDMSESGL